MMGSMHEQHSELLRAVDPAELGARIRAARVERGLTQTELGGDGVSTGYISRIESGARRPTLAVVTTLAQDLDISVEHLLRGVPRVECDEIRLLLNYAELALETGEAPDAEAQARSGLQRARAADQADLERRASYLLGRSVEVQGRLKEAIAIYEDLATRVRGIALAECGIALTRCYKEIGDLTLAVETGERIERQLHESGAPGTDESIRLAITVAGAYIMRGDLHRAALRCEQALAAAEQLGSATARASAYWNASLARSEAGETKDAILLAERALALLGEGNDGRNIARLRAQLGRLLVQTDQGDIATAFVHLKRARRDLAQSSASATHVAMADLGIAQAHLVIGEAYAAADVAERALLTAPSDAALLRAEVLVTLAQASAQCGNHDTAQTALADATDLLTSLPPERAAAPVWTQLAAGWEATGDERAALAAYRSATELAGLTTQHPAQRAVLQPS